MFAKMMTSSRFLNLPYSRCLIFLAVLLVLFSTLSPYFLSLSNLDNILSAAAVSGLLALGATFVIGNGGIDLSIASVMAFSGTLGAHYIRDTTHSPFLALLICILAGAGCGMLTGVLVNITKAPSFIVSLGMMSVARAAAFIVADGMPIYGLPATLTELGQGRTLGISNPVYFLLLATVFAAILLHKTVFGRHTLVFGDNPDAARSMGIRDRILRIQVFTISGILSGISGFVFIARTNAGDPTAGQNYELLAITAVILGGTNLFGGNASIFGTLLGVLCLGTLQNGLNLLAVSAYYQILFVGFVLISAALLERLAED